MVVVRSVPRCRSRIDTVVLTDFLNKCLLVGSRGGLPQNINFLDSYFLKFPFLGFQVILTGMYWPDFNLKSVFDC